MREVAMQFAFGNWIPIERRGESADFFFQFPDVLVSLRALLI